MVLSLCGPFSVLATDQSLNGDVSLAAELVEPDGSSSGKSDTSDSSDSSDKGDSSDKSDSSAVVDAPDEE